MVESVVTSAANESEMTNFPETIRQASLGGKFYMIRAVERKANREFLQGQKLQDGLMRKKPGGKELSGWDKLRNNLLRDL